MRRWLTRLLIVVLYIAMMAVLVVVLKATVPGFNRWLSERSGEAISTIIVFGLIGAVVLFSSWPRDADGKMKSLLPRRR